MTTGLGKMGYQPLGARLLVMIRDRLAGVAGLAPVPRDSGKVSGNLRRPRRYSRRLQRVLYIPAQVAATHCPESQRFYRRKRAEGKSHKQAIIALARRRLNVLWALIRDHRTFEPATPPPAGTGIEHARKVNALA